MPDITIPTHKFSLGRRVVYKQKDRDLMWGTVESFDWDNTKGEYVYIIACADGHVVKLLESQLRGFDRLV